MSTREIYLDHADHGATCVYQTADAVELEKKGWVRRPKDWVHPKLREEEVEQEEVVEAPKRGRPPKK